MKIIFYDTLQKRGQVVCGEKAGRWTALCDKVTRNFAHESAQCSEGKQLAEAKNNLLAIKRRSDF
tara:strand:+ start:99 stop:293 length:195 start_codon:yes stop_codon:yes gene_type:complete